MGEISVDDIMRTHPCEAWPRARVAALYDAAPKPVTYRSLANCSAVPVADRRLTLIRMLPVAQRPVFARWCSARAADAADAASAPLAFVWNVDLSKSMAEYAALAADGADAADEVVSSDECADAASEYAADAAEYATQAIVHANRSEKHAASSHERAQLNKLVALLEVTAPC